VQAKEVHGGFRYGSRNHEREVLEFIVLLIF
jgi:hypothetical protein